MSRYVSLDRLPTQYRNSFMLFIGTSDGTYSQRITDPAEQRLVELAHPFQIISTPYTQTLHITDWNYRATGDVRHTYGACSVGYSSISTSYRIGPSTVSTSSAGNKITVIDDHGQHYGLGSGDRVLFAQGFGVQHATTNEGWIFDGWRVTCANYDCLEYIPGDITYSEYVKIISSGGTLKKGTELINGYYQGTIDFLGGYENAICGKATTNASSQYDLTIEALYHEDTPVPPTPGIGTGAMVYGGSGSLTYVSSGALAFY